MSTALAEPKTEVAKSNGNAAQLPAIRPPRLPFHPAIEERFGVGKAEWKALVEAVFPLATSVDSVILALSYCKARKLDPFKRNIHIVPIWNKQLNKMVDTVWPGIGELRTTAFRTGQYAGRGETVYGPDITKKVGNVEVTFPEWAQVTVQRLVEGKLVNFAGPRVYWLETYAHAGRNDVSPNSMWARRTRGQIDKCAEAAALRSAFPEEIGNEYTNDEVGQGQFSDAINTTATPKAPVEDGRAASEKLADILEEGTGADDKAPAGTIDELEPVNAGESEQSESTGEESQQVDSSPYLIGEKETSKKYTDRILKAIREAQSLDTVDAISAAAMQCQAKVKPEEWQAIDNAMENRGQQLLQAQESGSLIS